MNLPKLLFFKVFLIALLWGCETVPRAPEIPPDFQLRGTVGVTDDDESFPAMRFLWRQYGADFDIELWGPLGQGRVRLTGDGQRLALVDGDGRVLAEGGHDDVMHAHLGWSLPLEVLPDWVFGEPGDGPGVSLAEYDDAGRLVAFSQLGWAVAYGQYREVNVESGARWLPRRVTAQRDDYRVKLVISEWQIRAPEGGLSH